MRSEVKLDLSKFKSIQKELKKNLIVKIGILGSKDNRDKDSNASIGLAHEAGSQEEGIPRRSFLLDPLEEKLPTKLNEIGKNAFKSISNDNIENVFEKLGVIGEEIVQEAFDTGGFGKWPALSESTIEKKGFDTILVETTQLRKAVTSEVSKNDS